MKNIFNFMSTMSSENSFSSVRSESAPRAPAVPQLATGMTERQREARFATGVESGDQAWTGGTDLASTPQKGLLKCPGCGGKPGNEKRCSLDGAERSALR